MRGVSDSGSVVNEWADGYHWGGKDASLPNLGCGFLVGFMMGLVAGLILAATTMFSR